MNERLNEIVSQGIFNATRTGNGFNKIMTSVYSPAKQEREILFEATRTCVGLPTTTLFIPYLG